MPISAGSRLGPYEILAPLGAGGMGEVYRARDSKLGREVAIKILPPAFALDPERLARFQREAKVLASLNHPHIAQIYGLEESDGGPALVMEFIPGSTLRCPLPLETALDYARQIAEALESAHERGITHRDLKPANIMVAPDGAVKVLDFGLATVPVPEREDAPENSPTLTMAAATQAGTIVGTAAYMSPEQAAGKPVDRRSDIWSFGVVLYEMLSGQRLFESENISYTLPAVLRGPINLEAVPAETRPSIRDLLRRSLTRDPRKRLRDIGDARIVIEEALAGAPNETAAPAAPARPAALTKPLLAASAILAVALTALAFVHFREQPPPPAERVRLQIPAPVASAGFSGMIMGPKSAIAISPDGRRLAFNAFAKGGHSMIWLRSLDNLDAQLLAGTEGANFLFWSPDSRFLAFFTDNKLKKIDVTGGPPRDLCTAPGVIFGGSWQGATIYLAVQGKPLMTVPDSGGTPTSLAQSGVESPVVENGAPVFLPDNRHFLQFRGHASEPQAGIYLASIDTNPSTPASKLAIHSTRPEFAYGPSADPNLGYILFPNDASLMAQPFNVRAFQLAGSPVPVAEDVLSVGSTFSASGNGVLAFRTGAVPQTITSLLWFDRKGKQLGQLGPEAPYSNVALAPDGKSVIVDFVDGSGRFANLSSGDTVRGVFTRINPGDISNYSGVPSPDGRVAFTYVPPGSSGDIYIKSANGSGAAELLVSDNHLKHPNRWSSDGRYLIYDEHGDQKQDLWIVPMTGDHTPIPFLVTPADETDASFSPDTRWIAYSSDEIGTREVYVQGFLPDRRPAAGIGKWRISAAGGAKPIWSRDGKELYYIAADHRMMAVPIKSTDTTFEPGIAAPLFETHTAGYVPFDVAPDGRFLIDTVLAVQPHSAPDPLPITVILNWTAGLKK